MKKNLIILLLIPFFSFAQVNLDSLWNVWNDESQEDTNRLKSIKQFSWDGYLFSQPDSAFYFAQLQYDFAKERNLKKYTALALNIQGASFHIRSDFANALSYYLRSLKIKEEIDDKIGIGASLNNIANIYQIQGDYTRAIETYTKSLKIKKEIGDTNGIAGSLNNIGLVYEKQGNYAEAIKAYTKSLNFAEKTGVTKLITAPLNNIGIIYQDQKDFIKALEYYRKSLNLEEKSGDKISVSTSFNNIGTLHKELGDYDKALKNYEKSLALKREVGDKKGITQTLINIGVIKQNQGDYVTALRNYNSSLEIQKEIGYRRGASISLSNIGIAYQEQKEYSKAIYYGLSALKITEEVGNNATTMNASFSLWKSYKAVNQFKEALKMYELYIETKNYLDSEENKKEIIHQKYKYEYEKQKVLDDAAHEKQLLIENETKSKQKMIMIAFSIGLLFLFLFILNRYKTQQKILKQKVRLEALEKEKVEAILKRQEKELALKIDALQQNLKIVEHLKKSAKTEEDIDTMIKAFDQNYISEPQWDNIITQFGGIHQNFVESLVLDLESVTRNDIKLGILLKLKYSNKGMEEVLNISAEGVKKAKQRFKKKLKGHHLYDVMF